MHKTLFYSLVLIALPALAQQASGASLCRSVLQSISLKSARDIETSIQQIAEMKLQYDLLQLQGLQQESSQRAFSLQFPQKYQELIAELKNQLSEKEIQELIKKEVRRQQGLGLTKDAKEKDVREEHGKIISNKVFETKSYKYVLKTNELLAEGTLAKADSALYIPQSKKVFYISSGSFHSELLGNTPNYLFPADSFALLSDHKTLLIRQNLQFLTFDLATETIIATRDINFAKSEADKQFEKILLDPKENYALLTGEFPVKSGTALSLIDLRTGTEILSHDQLPSDLNAAAFLDGEHLAVLHDGNKLSIINIASGTITQNTTLSLSRDSYTPNLILAKNGEVLSVYNKRKIISVDPKKISLEIASVTRANSDNDSNKAMLVPGYEHALVEVDYYNGAKIFNMETLDLEFDFTNKYVRNKSGISKIIPSLDGDSILAIYSVPGVGVRHQIDIWQREKAQP